MDIIVSICNTVHCTTIQGFAHLYKEANILTKAGNTVYGSDI